MFYDVINPYWLTALGYFYFYRASMFLVIYKKKPYT